MSVPPRKAGVPSLLGLSSKAPNQSLLQTSRACHPAEKQGHSTEWVTLPVDSCETRGNTHNTDPMARKDKRHQVCFPLVSLASCLTCVAQGSTDASNPQSLGRAEDVPLQNLGCAQTPLSLGPSPPASGWPAARGHPPTSQGKAALGQGDLEGSGGPSSPLSPQQAPATVQARPP